MPHFFFHFDNAGKFEPDEEGTVFASSEEAYIGAYEAICEMWSSMLHDREDPSCCAFQIADGSGQVLHRLPFVEVLETCGWKGQADRPRPDSTFSPAGLNRNKIRAILAADNFQTSMSSFERTLAETRGLFGELDKWARGRPFPPDSPA